MPVIQLVFLLILAFRKSYGQNGCDEPLGLEDERIKDSQITASSAFNNDFSTYGGHQARLNKKTYPPGYRSDENSLPWLKVEFNKPMVVTSIATQGYGDDSVAEWLTEFFLFYADNYGQEFKAFSRSNNNNFVANKDRHSVKLNHLSFPVVTKSILLQSKEFHRNVAFRMELYGCKPGYYFAVWLMVRNETFRHQYMYSYTEVHKTMKEKVVNKVSHQLEKVSGYISTRLLRFSPKPYKMVSPYLVAELEIYCLERDQEKMLYEIQMLIKQDKFFETSYLITNYPLDRNCLPPLIDIGLPKNPFEAEEPTPGVLVIKMKTTNRCNEKDQATLLGCIGTGIGENEGLFKYFFVIYDRLKKDRERSINRRYFEVGGKSKLAYIMCFAILEVNKTFYGENYEYGFVQLNKNKIVARINGPDFVIKGMNALPFDAYDSYHTLLPWNRHHELNFSWTLIPSKERNEVNSNILPAMFGDGVKVAFDVNDLNANATTYNITLVVTDVRKTGTTRKQVQVFDKPKVYIRCMSNCGPRHKGNTSRVFQMFCEGRACSKSQSSEWQLRYNNQSVSSVCDGQSVYQRSNLTLELFGFTCPGVGTLGITGIMHLSNNYTTLPIVSSFYLMIANTKRTCSVTPKSGEVLETNFNVSCVGWSDGGLFPNYNLFLTTDAGPIDLLLNESASVMLTILPTGDPKRDYKLNLNVNISYQNGEEECVPLDVKVFPMNPSAIFDMFKPGSNFTSMFLNLVKNGEVNKASTIAIAALSAFKDPLNESSKFENISVSLMAYKVKTDVLRKYKNVSINRVDEVSKLLYVIALCSEQNYSASENGYDLQENQINALDILATTTDFVSGKIESVPIKTYKRISKVTFNSLGSIMKSASNEAKTKQQVNIVQHKKNSKKIQNKRKIKAKKIIKKAMKITKKVAQYMSDVLGPGEQSTIDAPYMAMLILKGDMMTFSSQTIHFHNSIVRLPSHKVMFAGHTIKNYDLLDLKIILWRVNPLTWHYSSNSIKSAVVDVTLSLSKITSITHAQQPNSNMNNSSLNSEVDPTKYKPNHKKCNNTVYDQMNKTNNTKENRTREEFKILNLTVPVELFIPKYSGELQNLTGSEVGSEVFFVKPSTEDKDFLTYHQIKMTSPYVSINVNVKPARSVKFDLYIRYKEKPTSKDYNFKRQIPEYSSCYYDLNLKKYTNCSLDPYTFSFSAKDSGHTGMHYLGIRYLPSFYNRIRNQTTLTDVTEHPVIRVGRSIQEPCIVGGKRQKRACAEYKKPPPPRPVPTYKKDVEAEFDNMTDINYILRITSGTCMFWDVENQQWSTKGCKLGFNFTSNGVHCLCDHLTTFGGDFFVAPNPIDFSLVFKAFQSLDDSENIAILITVCVLLVLFLIGLFITRRYDKIDERKNVNRTIEMQGIANKAPHSYKIQIETGIWRGSGTTADVGIVIYGENGCTAPICITTSSDDDVILFARGSINTFNLLLNKSLGPLIKIKIWHDNTGTSPSWYAHQVMITDKETTRKEHFFINRWLAVDKRDGRIVTETKAFNKSDGNSFRDFFALRTARGFANDHLWVSIFTRPPHNPFTRSQRLACCMSILFATMITNAMFYQLGSKASGNKFNIGPIQMNLYAIKIGVQSAFISIPINVIIVMLFKKASNMINEDEIETKKRFHLSRLMVSLAWVLCCSVILVSAAFVVFYSMQWGKETSNNWLTSVVVSFIQDIFITSPIKVVCIAIVLSAVLTKPPKEDDIRYRKKASKVVNPNTIEQPEEEELEKARLYDQQTEEMFTVIRNLFRLIVLFILFMILCYGNRDQSRFLFTKSVKDVFHGFDEVHHHKQFWDWTRVVLVPGLFGTQWYNNQPFNYEEGFISNREAFLVGMPRLRQLRVKPVGKCSAYKKYPDIAKIFNRCLPSYSFTHEDRGPYYMQGWKTISNISSYKTKSDLDAICPEHWRYHTDDSQKVFHMMENSYVNGGYIAELGYNSSFALKTIQNLMDHKWLDDLTSAVFVEFTVFEPASGLLCVLKYVYEKYLHGKASAAMYIRTLVIYPPSDSKSKVLMYVSKIALLIYITILVIFEIHRLYLQRWRYFKSMWNWFEMLLLILCVMAMIMTSFVQYYASNFVQDVSKNPYKTWATDDLVFYSDFEICLFGFILFILTIKSLKIVSFNRPVLVMLMSLKRASKPLTSFSMVFFTAIAAFAMLAHVAFGKSMFAYSSLQNAFFEILQAGSLGGDLGFKKLYEISPILGPLYIFFLRFIITIVLVNIFIAILNFSYALSSAEMRANMTFKNLVILSFAKTYFKSLLLTDFKIFLLNLWKAILQKLLAINIGRNPSWNISKMPKRRKRFKTKESSEFSCERCVSSDGESKVPIESIYCEKHDQVETRRKGFFHIKGKSNCFSKCITGSCEERKSDHEEGILEEEFVSSHPHDEKYFKGENPICKHLSSEDSILSYNRADMPEASREDKIGEKKLSSYSDSIYDSYDDIEFIDDDYVIADMKKSFSEIRSSIAESFQSLSSSKPSRPHSIHLPQSKKTQSASPSSPSGSLLYSTSPSRSDMSLPRSRRSIETQSLEEADSDEWSFSSGYYRFDGAGDYKRQ